MLLQSYFPFPVLNRQSTFFKKVFIFPAFIICFPKEFCILWRSWWEIIFLRKWIANGIVLFQKTRAFNEFLWEQIRVLRKFPPGRLPPKKIAANSDPNPNPNPNPGGNLLGGNLPGAILRGEIFRSPQKRRVNKEYERRKVSGIQVLIFVPVCVFVFLSSIFLF